ncbi:unnamed protein product [Chrysoparadoxa australica]
MTEHSESLDRNLLADEDGSRGSSSSYPATRSPRSLSPTVAKMKASFQGGDEAVQTHSRFFTVLLLVNYMVGSGVLNQPQVFSEAGILSTTVMYIVAGFATWYGAVILVTCSGCRLLNLPDERLDYCEVGSATYGRGGRLAVDAAIIFANYGACMTYVLLIGSTCSQLLESWTGSTGPLTSFNFLAPAVTALFVLPICCLRHFTSLHFHAVIGVSSVLACLLLVVGLGPSVGKNNHEAIVWFDGKQTVQKFGSVSFSMSMAAAAFHAYRGLSPRTLDSWKKTVAGAIAAGGTICYVTGLCGYLSFRSATEGNILNNFEGPVAEVAKILLVLHLICFMPNEFIVMRHSLFSILGLDALEASTPTVLATTFALLLSLVGACLGLNDTGLSEGQTFGYILDLTGGIMCGLAAFVFPGLFFRHLAAGKKDSSMRTDKLLCAFLAAFGIISGAAVLVTTALELDGLDL